MSTFSYAVLTNARDAASPEKNYSASTGIKIYVDAVLALVPVEVLTLHAVIISATTTVKDNTTEITNLVTLAWSFYGLIVLSMVLYLIPRIKDKMCDKLDWFRIFIPPLAFIAWTMLQRVTAFDAAFPKLAESPRTVIALFLAVILGALSSLFAKKANHKEQKVRK